MKTIHQFFEHKFFPAILVFIISFVTYLATLAPTISYGDSAEFITVVYTLGISHPSGYPLYTLLGKLFTFLPFGSIGYRINLMSAVVASLTVALVYFIVLKITHKKSSGILASLILAFSFVFWAHAVRAEVYDLNALFLALILLILLKYDETKKTSILYLLAFVYGLSFTNHLITIILALPIFFFIVTGHKVRPNKTKLNLKIIIVMLLFFTIGLFPYLYLPLRASQHPGINWGNPENAENLFKHIIGNQYEYHMFEHTSRTGIDTLSEALYFLILQFTIFFGFSMIGIWKLWKTHKRMTIVLGTIILLNFMVALNYNIEDIIVYYIPSYLVISIFIGIGLVEIIDLLIPRYKTVLVSLIAGVMLCLSIILYHERINLHNDYGAYNYASFMFSALPKNSIIFADTDDELFPLWYMQQVMQKRDDIVIISTGMLPISWYIDMLRRQYINLTLPDYNNLTDELIRTQHLSYPEIQNISYISIIFRAMIKKEIVKNNKEMYRIYNFSISNISDIKKYNMSILNRI